MVYNFDQTGLHMEEVSISEFKARCLALLEQVNKTKKPLRVTRHGKPIAEVVPPTTVADRTALMGSMRGKIEILGDIVSPAADEDEWEVLGD
jgi:prevent-host-death family protein